MLRGAQKKRLTLALCIGVILLALVGLSYVVPLYEEICEQSEQTGAKECADYHLVSYAFWRSLKLLDTAGVAITALATLAIARFTWTLRRSTDRLWDAGERQLALTRDTAQRQLRAYVFVNFDDEGESIVSNNLISFAMKAVNDGTTPAYRFMQWSSVDVFAHPLPEAPRRNKSAPPDFDFSDLPPHDYVGMQPTRRRPLTVEEVDGLRDGRMRIYIWGKVYYRDAFKRRRYTAYCYTVPLPTEDGGFTGTPEIFRFGNHSN